MLKRCLSVLLASCLLLTNLALVPSTQVSAATQTSFYVSPTGSDLNPGTEALPFRTIEKAQSAVRTVNSNMAGDIIVYLRGGMYDLQQTLSFTDLDSGSNGYNVIYQAYENEQPVISGGLKVTGWTQVPGTSQWCASVPVDGFRQLYVNGNRAQRARSEATYTGTGWYKGSYSDEDGIIVDNSVIGLYNNASDVELSWNIAWRGLIQPVADIIQYGTNQKAIVMDQPYFEWGVNLGVWNSSYSYPFYIENAYELLDTPGEWYFNKTTQMLYYWPLDGEDMSIADVYVPQVEKLIDISGSSLGSKANNIQFKGLSFYYGAWDRTSEKGCDCNQCEEIIDGYNSSTKAYTKMLMPAQIQLNDAEYILFQRCRFEHLGSVGIGLKNGVDNVQIVGNIFCDISDSAITVGQTTHDFIDVSGEEVCTNNLINNNIITKIGQEYTGAPAITGFYVDGLEISHNDIFDIPYTGISLGWGWAGNPNSTTCRNNKILDNRISDFNKINRDGGGIYTLGQQPDSIITGNYISNENRDISAIYLDEGSRYFTVENNVVRECFYWFFNHLGYGSGIIVDNNYTTNNQAHDESLDTCCSMTNTHIVTDASWPQEAKDIISIAGLEKDYQDLLSIVPFTQENVAYGKSVTVSSGSAQSSYANDGLITTSWESDSSDAQPWWQVDLGNYYTINKIEIVSCQDTDNSETRRGYEVRASNSADFSNYVVLGNVGNTPFEYLKSWSHTVQDINSYRFVRVVKTGSASFAELRVYGKNNDNIDTTVPSEGLQLWLNASEDEVVKDENNYVSSWNDQSGNGHDAVTANEARRPLWVENAVNGYPALHFDGIDDMLISNNLPSIKDDFSLFFVIKPTGNSDYSQTFSAANTWNAFCLQASATGGIYAGTGLSSRIEPNDGPTDGTVETNKWQSFSFIYKNGTATLYKDGDLLASKTIASGESWSSLVIGSLSANNTINGDIAEVLLYNVGISDNCRRQIEAYFNNKFLITKQGLQLWLKANANCVSKNSEDYVSTWIDQSGNGHDAVISSENSKPLWVDNVVNGYPALQFDGIDDMLTSHNLPSMRENFSLFFVIKPANTADYNQTFAAPTAWSAFCLHTTSTGGIYVGTGLSSRIEPNDGPNAGTVEVGKWQSFSFIMKNGEAKLYKNGTLVTTKTLALGESWTDLVIGSAAASNTINGDVAEILLYNTAVPDIGRCEIESYLANKYLVTKEGMQLWLKSDESNVTKDANNYVSVWNDQSGNNLNAVAAYPSGKPLWIENAINGYSALRFDGIDDKIVCSNLPSMRDSFSLLFVIKPTITLNYNQTFSAPTAWNAFCFHTTYSGGIYAGTSLTSRIEPSDGPGDGTFETNKWQSYAFIFDNGTAKLYKNGSLLATKILSLGDSWSSLVLGSTAFSNTINGDVAEVMLYNTAISNEDLQTLETYFKGKYLNF